MEILSVKAAKTIDNRTINEIGMPSLILMENAAQSIFENIVHKGNKYILFCGIGNNGADGLAIARKLILQEKKVKVYIVSDLNKATDEFKMQYNILNNLDADIYNVSENNIENIIYELKQTDVVVDAIFGVGLNRNIEGSIYNIIDLINKYSTYIVSVDVPSGLECNFGTVYGIAVKANQTFTVEVLKKGFFGSHAKEYTGQVIVIKIGIPQNIKEEESEKTYLFSKEYYKELIPVRKIYGHKGDYGRVVILAGSNDMTGAAYITTESAVRVGAGLVTLVIEDEIQSLLSQRLIEAMTVGYSQKEKIKNLVKNADVIICGPGLSRGKVNKDMLSMFIENSNCNIVVDADALNIISENEKLLKFLKGRAVFTPHLGEMTRLTKGNIEEIETRRIDICKEYSKANEVVTLLKGYNTVISDGSKTIINETGNSKMASGGMGDCLSGIIGGLIAQGINNFSAAALGAYIHGLIGDELAKESYIVNARDIIKKLPKSIELLIK